MMTKYAATIFCVFCIVVIFTGTNAIICPPGDPDCYWGSWSSWSSCSGSTRTRSRSWLGSGSGCDCRDQERQTQRCTPPPCQSNPCQHKCTNTGGSYTCSCYSCYTKVGSTSCDLQQCKINNQCYAYGKVNPNNPCQKCDSAYKTAWTNDNSLPCSDGDVCTKNDHCSSGRCIGTPLNCQKPCEECYNDACRVKSGCSIDVAGSKTCFIHGDRRPGNPCQMCDPRSSTSVWTNRDGVTCDDGNSCTRADTCRSGQCTSTPFGCNSLCQFCNGNSCSLKTGFGFVSSKCTCRIGGQDYSHETENPSNQCQWCDLLDAAARANSAWSNRPAVPCDDANNCTKLDVCVAGSCKGQGYICQSSYPSSSCIRTSQCVGDGTCRYIMRSNGTICRSAADICDRPERCDGRVGTCPCLETDKIIVTTGIVQTMDQNFNSPISYQYITDRLFLAISGFSVSCGAIKLRWFVLPGTSACSGAGSSLANGFLTSSNIRQTVTGLALKDNASYKIAISASDLRDKTQQRVCSSVISVDTSKPTGGWIHDGPAADINYQSSKLFQVNWGGVQTRHGVGKYEWKVILTSFNTNQTTELTPFSSTNLNTYASKIINNITDGSKVEFVVRAYTKAGLFSDLTSNGVIVDTTPPIATEVCDGSTAGLDVKYTKWTNTFSANWKSFHDPHSPISRYMWAIQKQFGGLSTTYNNIALNRFPTFTGLSLVSGEIYCAVVRGYHKAGLYTQATSDCVLIDHDPPKPGTVNDGHFSDVDYQSDDTMIAANWNEFTDGDKGSGIVEYKYKITDENGSTILNWTSAGNATNITQTGLPLKNNTKYFVTVNAIDAVGLSTNVTSDGVLVDTSHPLAATIYDGSQAGSDLKYSTWTNQFSANWEPFTDPHSPITKYTWAVLQLNAGYLTLFKTTGLNCSATASNLNLASGAEYCAVVRGYNEAGLYTQVKSDCVLIDHDAPQAGTVNDGHFSDVDYQSDDTMIAANWNGFTDGNKGSGIVEYKYKITDENGSTILDWTSAGNGSNITQTGLPLKKNTEYFVTVSAIDAVGLSTNVTSDGVLVDTSHPLAAAIYDGSQAGSDLKYSAWTSTFSANWETFTDPHSPITKYTWAVQQLNAGYITSFKITGLNCSATASNLNLASGEKYCAVVRGYNEAGLYTQATSNCVLIDHDAPHGGTVKDGYVSDVDYQSDDTMIAANWNGFTDGNKGSGIVEYKYRVKDSNGEIIVPFTSVGNATSMVHSGLSLEVTARYFVTVKVVDAVGLGTDVTSDGVIIGVVNINSTAFVNVDESKSVIINCTIGPGTPTWTRQDGGEVQTTTRNIKDGVLLEIREASIADTGVYVCTNGDNKHTITVQVLVEVKVEMILVVLNYGNFTEELENKSSPVYKATEKNFTTEMDKVHKGHTPGYVKTVVLKFSEGSVKVDFEIIIVLVTNNPKNATTIADRKAEAAQRVVVRAKKGAVERLKVKEFVIVKTVPLEPENVEIFDIDWDELSVRWEPSEDADSFAVHTYLVQHRAFGDEDYTNFTEPSSKDKTQYSYRVKHLEPETTYMVRVAAINNYGPNFNEESTHQTNPAPFAWWIILVVVLIILLILGILVGVILYRRKRAREREERENLEGPRFDALQREARSDAVALYEEKNVKGLTLSFRNDAYKPSELNWEEIPYENLKLLNELGSGAFGVVYKGELLQDNGNVTACAVKTLKPSATKEEIRDLYNELEIMTNVGYHPNLVNLIGACTEDGHLLVVLEIAENGSLLEFLKKSRQTDQSYENINSGLTEQMKTKIASDVARGMAHLATCRCIHRDLAARNVLLGEDYIAKVSDYGMARDVYEQLMYKKETQGKLPVKWMAIESLETYIFTIESDVWAYGVLLWEIESGGLKPYAGLNTTELIEELKKGYRMEKPNGCSDEMYQVMRDCWNPNPKARPTFEQLVIRLEGKTVT